MLTRAPTGNVVIEVPTGRARGFRGVLARSRHWMCRCRHCQGTGLEPPRVDAECLVAAIVADFGLLSFTSGELLAHAGVVGGRLQALLEGHNANTLGWALKRVVGVEIGDYRLVRLGLERNRVVLWQVLPVS